MRYKEEDERCECGGKEDRDHLLLYCKKWEKEREEVWRGWWCGWLSGEGWIEIDRMLFGEEGVRRMVEFAVKIGWDKRKWKSWVGKGYEDRRGKLLNPRKEGGGGWLSERAERWRREIKEGARLRPARWREKKEKEGNVEEDELRRERRRVVERKRKEDIRSGVRVVNKRGGNDLNKLSERDRAVGRNLNRGGRNVLGELVNMGGGKGREVVLFAEDKLFSAASPIASGVKEDDLVLEIEE